MRSDTDTKVPTDVFNLRPPPPPSFQTRSLDLLNYNSFSPDLIDDFLHLS